ncbi:hypothetical protein LINPERHAP2_LOCUS33454 [Linum perenne]
MGNCSPKGTATTREEGSNPVLIRTHSGDILEFKPPKLAKHVLTQYPGFHLYTHAQNTTTPTPVPDSQYLIAGRLYYLAPVKAATAGPAEALPNSTALQVVSSHREGVWKVKVMIDPKRLEKILSDKENVEVFIQKMRMAVAAESLTPRRSSRYWKGAARPS